MIRAAAATHAIELITTLRGKGQTLVSIDSTAINNIVASMPDLYALPSAQGMQMASVGFQPEAQDPGMTSILMKEYTSYLVNTTSNVLALIRGNFSHVAQEFVAALSERFTALNKTQRLASKIIPISLPEPLIDHDLIDMIDEARDIGYASIQSTIALPNKVASEIQALMLTGNQDLDALINAWVAQIPTTRLEDIYQQLFVDGRNGGANAATAFGIDPSIRLDSALVAFLIARSIHDSPPEGVQGSLADYEGFMRAIKAKAAVTLTNGISLYSDQIAQGRLIEVQDAESIFVNAVVYQKWLDNGGNNDVIYGNNVVFGSSITINDLTANASRYVSAWTEYTSMRLAANNARMFAEASQAVTDALLMVVRNNINECFSRFCPDEDLTKIQWENIEGRSFVVDVKNKINLFCRTLTLSDIKEENLYRLAINALSATVFSDTDVACLMNGADQASRINPTMSDDQAMFTSVIDHMCKHVASQMVIVQG